MSFRTVEQAISAKQRMSRVHPWKSAISFAHKESQSNVFGMSPSSSPALPTQQGFVQQQQMQQSLGSMHMHRDMSSQQLQLAQYLSNNATNTGKSPLQQQHLDQLDGGSDEHMAAVLAMARSQSAAPAMQTSSSFGVGGGGNGSSGMYSDLQQPRPTKAVQQQQHRFGLTEDEQAAADNLDNNNNSNSNNMMFAPGASALIRPASTGSSSNNIGSSSAAERARNLALHVSTADGENRDDELFLMMMQQQLAQEQKDVRQRQMMLDAKADELATQLHAMGGVSGNDLNQKGGNIHQSMHGGMPAVASSQQNQDSEAVLRRLCDDTYVPTQPWPGNWEHDAFYCSAVVAQLQQFGGTTTISKLRGFLRSRVNATDNIKSVPLKAMLSGYPAFFVVRGNAVALTPPLCQGIPSNPMYGSSSSMMMSQPPLISNNQQSSLSPMHGLQQQQGLGGYNDYDNTNSIITGGGMGGMTVPGYNNVNSNNHFAAMQQQQMQMQSTNQEEQSLVYGDFMRTAAYQLKNNQSSSQSLVNEARERSVTTDFSQGDINININKNNINKNNTLLDPTLAASLLSISNLENSAGSSFSYGM